MMLKQKYLFDFAAKFFLYFMGSLVGIVIARVAGPDVVGTIAYGASFVGMFAFVFGLFGTSHIKIISENQELLGKCLRIYLTLLLVALVVFVTVVLSYFYFQKYYLKNEFSQSEQIVIFLYIGITGIYGLSKISEVTFVALTQQAKANIPALFREIIYQAGRLIVVLLGYGAVALVSVNLATYLLALPVFFWLMRKFPFRSEWDNALFKRYLTIGVPILIITVTNSIISNYGSIKLKDSSTVTELGFFAAGVSITGFLSMIGTSAGTIFFPLFSKAYAKNDMEYIKSQIAKYERFLYLFPLPLFLLLGVFSDPIIPFLMSDKYLPSVPVFTILVFASFFSINAMPYNNLIFGVGKFKVSAWMNVLFMFLFIGLLYVFLDPFFFSLGAVGLALVMLFHNLFKYIIWYYYIKLKYKIQVNYEIIKMFALNLLYFGILYYLKNTFLIDLNIFIYAVIALASLITFYVFIYILKIMNRKDLDFVLEIINVKKLISYTKDELKK